MAAAAAPVRRLLLRLRDPPQIALTPLLSRLAPHLHQTPTPTPASPVPASTPTHPQPPGVRDVLFSFHTGLQMRLCLDPICGDAEEVDDGGGAAAQVRADSVKKKRKRKMNKHKLRKLRKRLRRQT